MVVQDVGYSCFYLGESELALAYLEHAKLLGSEFADELLPVCNEMVMRSKPPSLDADFIAAFFAYMGCQCERIEPMEDDKSLIDKYNDACNQAEQEGFTPILILPNDTLFAQLLLNAQPENQERSRLDFSYLSVYREKMLNLSLPDGKVLLKKMLDKLKQDAKEDEFDWEKDILGEMKDGGKPITRFSAIWDFYTRQTRPLILAKIPVKNPWEIFAYLPFGAFNDCPDTQELMAVSKYWYEQHGAIPAVISSDSLEFRLDKPVNKDDAMTVALEQYAFCSDLLDGLDDFNINGLSTYATVLHRSAVWYFWWD